MSVTVTINGVDVTSRVFGGAESRDVSISETLNGVGTCEFRLIEPEGAGNPALSVELGHEVIFDHTVGRIFGGHIEEIRTVNVGVTDVLTYEVVCRDYSAAAERKVVPRVFEDPADPPTQTAGDIVTKLHSEFLASDGITLGDVESGPVIDRAIFNFVTVADALNQISELTGGAYVWRIGHDRALSFTQRTFYAAPFEISDAQLDFQEAARVRSLSTYRNRQYLRGGTDESDETTERFLGDGDTRDFEMRFPVSEKPRIWVNGFEVPPASVVARGDSDDDSPWVWDEGQIRVTAKDAPEDGAQVAISYRGQFPVMVLREDSSGIAARAAVEGGDGVYESVDSASEQDTGDDARELADKLLEKYSSIPERIEYTTQKQGQLRAGQLQTVNLTGLSVNAQYLIESLEIVVEADLAVYTANLTTGRDVAEWLLFWKEKVRNPRVFSLDASGGLLIPITEKEQVQVSDSFSAPQSNSLSPWEDDPYTVMLVGTESSIAKVLPDGSVDGPRIGDAFHP